VKDEGPAKDFQRVDELTDAACDDHHAKRGWISQTATFHKQKRRANQSVARCTRARNKKRTICTNYAKTRSSPAQASKASEGDDGGGDAYIIRR